ncbi:MAG: hypothetical protein ACRDHL_14840 [Candidatus Promineifilaceae bacterium]
MPTSWPALARIALKAAALFAALNLLFAWLYPVEALGRLSLYNWLIPGRLRLPYGEQPAESYNLSLNNVPGMLASHAISRPKAADEFRLVVIGDSGAWGWLLEFEDTLAGQLNRLGLTAPGGRRVVAYNLGYPILALTKDALWLHEALAFEPDLILWPLTLESFRPEQQLAHPLLQHNPGRVRALIERHGLKLDPADPRFVEPGFWARTLVGQRRPLADLLRLQLYGFSWAATGVDQATPRGISLRQSDFEADLSWGTHEGPAELSAADLAFDALAAGVAEAGAVPLLVVNEPIFISAGRNSDLRFNAWYPRWAYDQYRDLLATEMMAHAGAAGGRPAALIYLDLWDAVAPAEFTDSPVHLTPRGTQQFAAQLAEATGRLAAASR